MKTKIDSMCGCPKKEKMTFYAKETDETIGNMLKKMCKNASSVCDHCKEPMFKHFTQYYHKDGCVEIQLQLQQQDPLKKTVIGTQGCRGKESRKEIIMRGEC